MIFYYFILPYAIPAETLRKYPLQPNLVRVTSTDYHLPQTQLTLPRGTRIIIPFNEIHKDPEYYPNPEQFDPERFSLEALQHRHPCKYMPFGDGPRMCSGWKFARLKLMVALIMLLDNFRFSMAKTTPRTLTYKTNTLLRVPLGKVELNVDILEK